MANSNLNKARELLIKKYTDALKQSEIPWERGWHRDLPRNAITKTEYRGVNSLLLSFIADERGYSGNRWCTFNQIADKDGKYHPNQKWHLKKGSISVPVEYWYLFNKKEQKKYPISDYRKLIKDYPERDGEFVWISKTYLVFNEDCIEGIPKEVPKDRPQIDRLDVIDKIITNMGVDYEEYGNQAYYSSLNDKVVIPPMETFKNEYFYCATQLHELCHATGHSSRLDRKLGNEFGSEDYAKEELRAEIGSSFLMQELDLEYDESHMENHAAYIQSWISVLEKDPNELFRAIQDANDIVEYVEEKGEINKEAIQTEKTTSLDTVISDWYFKTYPQEIGQIVDIDSEVTFNQLNSFLKGGKGDVYEFLGVHDSVVRERVFTELSGLLNVDYDTVYNMWIDLDTTLQPDASVYDTVPHGIPTVKVGDQEKAYFTDYEQAKAFAQSVNGTLSDVDFLGGYEVYFVPERNTTEKDDYEMEMQVIDVKSNKEKILAVMNNKEYLKELNCIPYDILTAVEKAKSELEEVKRIIENEYFEDAFNKLRGFNNDGELFDFSYGSLNGTVLNHCQPVLNLRSVGVYPDNISNNNGNVMFDLDFTEEIELDKIKDAFEKEYERSPELIYDDIEKE